ncbi:Putative amido hydrolase [Salmonella enterica subsp. enterica]|nr:Putative amido hydrolase [Salmonella enterica subsp. enterica] [Salmonella enterica subsp. enterica serovar Menston]
MLFRMAVETMKRKSLCPPGKLLLRSMRPLNASPAEHVAHHLEYIELAARQQCELLVFPSLSLLGCDERNKSLPAPA